MRLDLFDDPVLDLRNRPLLEPVAVAHEVVERHRTAERAAVSPLEHPERHRSLRVGDVARLPVGPEEHPLRHLAPEGHGIAEDAGADSGLRQARCSGQAVRSGADDRDRRCAIAVQRGRGPDGARGSLGGYGSRHLVPGVGVRATSHDGPEAHFLARMIDRRTRLARRLSPHDVPRYTMRAHMFTPPTFESLLRDRSRPSLVRQLARSPA